MPPTSLEGDPKIQAEIKYYLDRHNVQDEGYEVVVGFIEGKRHHIEINPHVTLRNVGTWKDYEREHKPSVKAALKDNALQTAVEPKPRKAKEPER